MLRSHDVIRILMTSELRNTLLSTNEKTAYLSIIVSVDSRMTPFIRDNVIIT